MFNQVQLRFLESEEDTNLHLDGEQTFSDQWSSSETSTISTSWVGVFARDDYSHMFITLR